MLPLVLSLQRRVLRTRFWRVRIRLIGPVRPRKTLRLPLLLAKAGITPQSLQTQVFPSIVVSEPAPSLANPIAPVQPVVPTPISTPVLISVPVTKPTYISKPRKLKPRLSPTLVAVSPRLNVTIFPEQKKPLIDIKVDKDIIIYTKEEKVSETVVRKQRKPRKSKSTTKAKRLLTSSAKFVTPKASTTPNTFSKPVEPMKATTKVQAVRPSLPKSKIEPVAKSLVKTEEVKLRIKTAKPRRSIGKLLLRSLFFLFTVISVALLVLLFLPVVYYRIFPSDPVPVRQDQESLLHYNKPQTSVLPVQNPDLPDGTWLIIPRIGVRTEIREADVPDEALSKGVWRVPEYGKPGDLSKPMILAAHRYGYLWWWKKDSEYWRYNSFYLLPDLQPGDTVEVIDDHRRYTYQIYGGEEGTEILDYNADLILYTCKFLNSPLRHFRYAKLIDPNSLVLPGSN